MMSIVWSSMMSIVWSSVRSIVWSSVRSIVWSMSSSATMTGFSSEEKSQTFVAPVVFFVESVISSNFFMTFSAN
jgi:hypothetical protein